MCGQAAPITCDNFVRRNEIIEQTRHIGCVLGCFCAQGYLRDNYNGKCVPEQECQNNKSVDISPQIPGLFKHLIGCGSGGCDGDGCGPNGCGSQNGTECETKRCDHEGMKEI